MNARRGIIALAAAVAALLALLLPVSGATAAPVVEAATISRATVPTWPSALGASGFFAASCTGATAPCWRGGARVTAIQKRLIALKYTSYGVQVSGKFDAATGRAVQAFKKRERARGNDIGSTPRVGRRTFSALFAGVASGGSGGSSSGSTGGTTTVTHCGSYSGRTCKTTATNGRYCPVIGAYLGDGFGVSRGDHSHQGIDLMVRGGTKVHSPEAGVVVGAGTQSNGAKAITIKGRSGAVWYEGHNSQNLVSTGDTVSAGQVIALSGDTGSPGAFHVHFEYRPGSPGEKWYYSTAVNPAPLVKSLCF